MIGGVCWLTFEPAIEGRVHKRSAGGNEAARSINLSPRVNMSLWWGPLTTQLKSTRSCSYSYHLDIVDDIYGEPGWSKSCRWVLLVLQIMVAGMNQKWVGTWWKSMQYCVRYEPLWLNHFDCKYVTCLIRLCGCVCLLSCPDYFLRVTLKVGTRNRNLRNGKWGKGKWNGNAQVVSQCKRGQCTCCAK